MSRLYAFRMSLMHVQWSSQVLGQKVSMNVIVPDRLEPPFAVFYLLHGLSDDYSIWLRRTKTYMCSAPRRQEVDAQSIAV